MTDKVQKIKDWISKEQDGFIDANGNFEYPEHEGAYNILFNLDAYIDSLQEEPKFKTGDRIKPIDSCLGSPRTIVDVCDGWYVTDQGTLDFEYEDNWELVEEPISEDLEKASKEWLIPQLDKSYANYGEVKMMELTHFDGYAMLDAIEFGAKWQEANLWKPADGEDLPEIDREVVVLIKYGAQHNIHDKEYSTYRVGFGHRPNPDGWDGKNLSTNEVTHYTPKLYDKGGWNIPNVKYWLDVDLPKLED